MVKDNFLMLFISSLLRERKKRRRRNKDYISRTKFFFWQIPNFRMVPFSQNFESQNCESEVPSIEPCAMVSFTGFTNGLGSDLPTNRIFEKSLAQPSVQGSGPAILQQSRG
jgi:hypothetical protein